MRFEQLKRRVERSEHLVEGRIEQTRAHAIDFKTTWRESWTPGRIVIAGLIAGFVVGRTRPTRALHRLGKLGGARWLQLIGPLSGLLASLRSAMAAASAAQAAEQLDDDAERVADHAERIDDAVADGAVEAVAQAAPAERIASAEPEAVPPADRRRRPDPVWDAPPRPAEAATELSER